MVTRRHFVGLLRIEKLQEVVKIAKVTGMLLEMKIAKLRLCCIFNC